MNTLVMKSDLKKQILDEKWYDNKGWFDGHSILN